MSNVTESGAVWEPGVYQIKTTDPVLGGPNGIANVQAVQLANRTAYLKIRADDVDAARGASPTLAARIAALAQSVTSLSPETQNAVIAALKFAIDQANVANKGVQALHQFAQQEGLITIRNRGIVRGCTVTRSTTATRNLSLDAGACFAGGQVMDVDATANAGSVPSNPGSGAATVFAFLHQGAEGRWRLAVTALGQPVPDHGIVIYQLTVPGGSSDATDPSLANVSLIDLRRIEPLFPRALQSPASLTQPITVLPDGNYHLSFDMVAAQGAPADADSLVVSSRAGNGFTVRLASAADNVVARYRLSRLNA